LHEKLERLEWRGEQVYRTPTHNDVASWAIVDQLMPLLPKDNEQFTGKVKQLCSLVEVAMLTNHAFVQEVGK
jgi:hypothetical protein